MWTGLDPNAPNAYSECLKAKRFSQPGLHLGVKSATKTQVSVMVVWTPLGPNAKATPQWTWKGEQASSLPKALVAGTRIVVLPRPNEQQVLAVNFEGRGDSLVINPYPQPPEPAEFRYEEVSEVYKSPEIAGWGKEWSHVHLLCTDEKPPGWTIARVEGFYLQSSTERGACGHFTRCGGNEQDTPRRACRTIQIQGMKVESTAMGLEEQWVYST